MDVGAKANRAGQSVVFLGPSLPVAQARSLLDAQFLPPAERGSVHRALSADPRVIVLVDGVFHGSPSIWQRELLDAIEDGVTVIGAASMGALRAVELAPLGMIGCGQVFRWYRDGVIEADDEVALLHSDAESGYRALSEPLVNIRATLAAAVRAGCLTSSRAETLIEYARRLHYPERCWPGLLHSPVTASWSCAAVDRLATFIATRRRDIKRADARAALRLAARLGTGTASMRRAIRIPSSAHGLRKAARTLQGTVPGPDGPVPATEVLSRARHERPELTGRLRARVSRRFFLTEWARHHELSAPPAELDQYASRWADRYQANPTEEWLHASGLTRVVYRRLLAERAQTEWILHTVATARIVDHATPTPSNLDTEISAADRLVLAWAARAGVLTALPATAAEQRATSAWIVERGPAHFGLPWNEMQALVEELQMTGAAAELAKTARTAAIP
jgi:hypothetical protein